MLVTAAAVAGGTYSIAQSNTDLPQAPSAIASGNRSARLALEARQQVEGAQPLRVGDFTVERATAGALPLTLDDAVNRGFAHNLQLLLATQTQQSVQGQILGVFFNLLPNLRATAYTRSQEINLAALGFKPASLGAFGLPANAIHTIVKVDTTSAQLSADQVLFNLPDLYLYLAAKKAGNVVAMNTLNVRGGVVQAVASQYLAALADDAQIANAQALVTADEEVLRQATLSHEAGVGMNIDVIRARVQLQTEQQALVRAQNTFAKDKIALNRLIGLPAEQELELTDSIPYADLAALPLEQAKTIAYSRRKDLLALEAELEVEERAQKAARFERLPSVSFNGYYGVLGETRGLYHGVFAAQGVMKIPIFEEARFRGEEASTAAEASGLRRQIESLKVTIDEQIRASMLDVQSSAELVKVARSNVDLATQALADTRDQFAAGVADNLPVVQAQAVLAGAQTRLIATEYQYNEAKLALARNTGVIEINYRQYLGR
ncbi:MAG TPA: TolC family protein [Acidobacteriaceae bacterium]|nr:TolC family protein [Acidobacteriaceae bacterium]